MSTVKAWLGSPEHRAILLSPSWTRIGISREDVSAIVGRTPDIYVPSDRDIPKTLTDGLPIVMALPQSDASQAFRGLATSYLGRQESGAAEEAAAGKGRRLFGKRG